MAIQEFTTNSTNIANTMHPYNTVFSKHYITIQYTVTIP